MDNYRHNFRNRSQLEKFWREVFAYLAVGTSLNGVRAALEDI